MSQAEENPLGNFWRTNVSMHDPIADMLTRIRNGQQARHVEVSFSASKLKAQICRVLAEEGFIENFINATSESGHPVIVVKLKYFQGQPVIRSLKRISRPGLRIYRGVNQLKPIPGFGLAILSTSSGVMTSHQAKEKRVGGEVICEVA
jgi:small subunit ribosomal protein S8